MANKCHFAYKLLGAKQVFNLFLVHVFVFECFLRVKLSKTEQIQLYTYFGHTILVIKILNYICSFGVLGTLNIILM